MEAEMKKRKVIISLVHNDKYGDTSTISATLAREVLAKFGKAEGKLEVINTEFPPQEKADEIVVLLRLRLPPPQPA